MMKVQEYPVLIQIQVMQRFSQVVVEHLTLELFKDSGRYLRCQVVLQLMLKTTLQSAHYVSMRSTVAPHTSLLGDVFKADLLSTIVTKIYQSLVITLKQLPLPRFCPPRLLIHTWLGVFQSGHNRLLSRRSVARQEAALKRFVANTAILLVNVQFNYEDSSQMGGRHRSSQVDFPELIAAIERVNQAIGYYNRLLLR
ncbi:MAG: hypothetical protein EZS28_049362, partial [Streblomastix strix]